ncbi:pyruvate formate-lyase-activating protein [Clostridium botulinum]|uniref:Pyruvate formate-lyase-activating enzyme n=2 Tax=Clostridium botulinum TaxID=1491 RepID=C1FL89_CLOBJ|nr:pyruvate formate-lyase-activating protein [Clostridium botulinum]ACO87187.1 pyruvate formate-lyase activating enzyme [Clostridium botulinum A2 str. Kyoto]APH22795.1 pyruvate formate-lyase 1-activating enzyme [Clostridium botulinum]APQ70512.1 pyruvate formate-lyase 1-activating enzyme [Clostridium botulinum]AUN08363.1 pyruvate formate-lyase 1-activating enzyme [Clostridium botulinum]EPS54969.1 pyruvate formate-lyase activating enzyme [Clostridium botulinum Af84]
MGKIHSIETMGLVDGPGIRVVVFFQGCQLRCVYCHNPDTWDFNAGIEISSDEVLKKVLRYKPYFKQVGGITCSGGEPLMQPEFLLEILKKCENQSIHTALDTSGVGIGNYEEILQYVDLVILDIKHIEEEKYIGICGKNMEEFNKFKRVVNKLNKKLWIRHVVVPGINDTGEHIYKFKDYINTFNNVEKVELLPYHTLGVSKYENMGIEYKLKNTSPLSKDKLEELKKIISI